jgi:hypothetical protein
MNSALRYSIEPGQVYARMDGGPGRVVVRDVSTFAEADDVVIYDELNDEERRVSAFNLAKTRYYLVDFSNGDTQRDLLHALRNGQANEEQQRKAAQLFLSMRGAMEEQRPDVRRGRFIVDNGEWRYLEDDRDGKRTWLCIRVAPDADLSCKGTRASALDQAMAAEASKT